MTIKTLTVICPGATAPCVPNWGGGSWGACQPGNIQYKTQTDGCGNSRVVSQYCCYPVWNCESPLNGYKNDGCGNRVLDSSCNPQVTAPVTSVTVTFRSNSPSGGPTGWSDIADISITTGYGWGSQPDIPITIDGSSSSNVARTPNTTTNFPAKIEVFSTGAIYHICADATCYNYTSSCAPVTAPITYIAASYADLRIDGSGNVWDDITLTITTGQGYCAQPTIPISVDGITHLQLTRPINSTFTYPISVMGKAGGSVYVICADGTHCVNYTSQIQNAAANGSTPTGTVVCIISVTQLATITGWNGSKYQTSYQGNFYYPINLRLGVC